MGLVPELPQGEGESVVHKQFGDSFEETELEDVLAGAGVGHLIVAGAATDACIRSTIHGAVTRGYDVTLVGDAHTTGDLTSYGAPPPEAVIAHTNLYWSFHEVPGRTTAVVDTADVQFTGDDDRDGAILAATGTTTTSTGYTLTSRSATDGRHDGLDTSCYDPPDESRRLVPTTRSSPQRRSRNAFRSTPAIPATSTGLTGSTCAPCRTGSLRARPHRPSAAGRGGSPSTT